MFILILMAIGILIGYFIFPQKLYKANSILQLACTLILIFSMGVLLGSRENFAAELLSMGIDGLVLAILPMGGSAIVVYLMTTWYEKWKRRRKYKKKTTVEETP